LTAPPLSRRLPAMSDILAIDRLDLTFTPKPWTWAMEHRPRIDAHFAARQRATPALWNGRVLMLYSYTVTDGVFAGAYLETDYASFAAWCDWGRPPAGVYDCFGTAAVRSADGAYLLGVMGERTLNAGGIYFPCGTPDPGDIVDGHVDFDLSIRRELEEETGLDAAAFVAEPGWTSVVDGTLIAQIKLLQSRERADTLRARMMEHLARDDEPELADIRIVREPADFDPAMRRFVTVFLAHQFGHR
jgi:8-oxo-dGTP pyrophosphatase MutT (NUDIX family)